METSSNPARRNPDVRAALKKQQQARLALKQKMIDGEIEPEVYSKAYDSQPEQMQKRKVQEIESAKRRNARKAANTIALTNAQGGADAFKGESK